jgi:hypothetical protein
MDFVEEMVLKELEDQKVSVDPMVMLEHLDHLGIQEPPVQMGKKEKEVHLDHQDLLEKILFAKDRKELKAFEV